MKHLRLMAATTLENAVAGISTYMDHHKKISAVDASLILSYIFDIPKEDVLELLIEYRRRKE